MTDTTPPVPTPAQKSTVAMVWIALGGVGIVALLCVGGLVYNAVTGGGASGAGASTACKEYVRDSLRAPSTAEFSRLQLTGQGRRWTVTGTVDAENLLGASVRMEFTCTVDGAGNDWRLISLTGLDG